MTDNHPITPPPELVQEWWEEARRDKLSTKAYFDHVATNAAQWGADQQLEKDAEWLDTNALFTQNLTISPSGDTLRQAMRPKPPSLKEQALAELELLRGDANAHGLGFDAPAIRRALEALPD